MGTIPGTSAPRSTARAKWHLLPVLMCITIIAIAATAILAGTGYVFNRDQNNPGSEAAAESSPLPATEGVKMYTYEIVRKLPHDARAFTQGLEYEVNGGVEVFWESTGLYNKSQLREVHVDNGTVIRAIDLPPTSFGEGVTRTSSGGLIQLTWKTGVTFEYPALDTFHTGNFTLAASAAESTKGGCSAPGACDVALAEGVVQRHTGLKDGWGIASDGAGTLVVTDSSETMYFFDEVTLEEKRKKVVTFEGTPLPWVNELEWLEGEVWGNVWMTPCIARIDPESAAVTGWILLEGLREMTLEVNKEQGLPMDVLNGIAYDAAKKRIFVTGKQWAQMYEIKVSEYPEVDQKSQLAHARTVCKPRARPI